MSNQTKKLTKKERKAQKHNLKILEEMYAIYNPEFKNSNFDGTEKRRKKTE